MNFILILFGLMVMALTGVSQEYKSRFPQPQETVYTAGLDWYPRDGWRHNPWITDTLNTTNYVLGDTNNFLVLRNATAAVSNGVVVLPNPTNSFRYYYKIVCSGLSTATLTNAQGGSLQTITNAFATTYSIATNSTVECYSSGTNWFIVPDRF